ncbi:hypothetical protein [Gloeocapsa sp. PCC 73106]|uniref:hypothetical protein n=1 Tax=Gloeocapsa sp. PCC 73106 TaxID=102232 RepID=UPI0002ACE9FA|nr:hypothetical protein [Gloeocapsa sp. PCC 73106]ELR96435.1 hypothetical protein GLO73106DRAFT_00002290 [Gloeocapsa sp. PCC 73106]
MEDGISRLNESVEFLNKGLEISQLNEVDKKQLYPIIDLVIQKNKLVNLAATGQLVSQDLVLLKQAEDVLKQYMDLIVRIRELNRNN